MGKGTGQTGKTGLFVAGGNAPTVIPAKHALRTQHHTAVKAKGNAYRAGKTPPIPTLNKPMC